MLPLVTTHCHRRKEWRLFWFIYLTYSCLFFFFVDIVENILLGKGLLGGRCKNITHAGTTETTLVGGYVESGDGVADGVVWWWWWR